MSMGHCIWSMSTSLHCALSSNKAGLRVTPPSSSRVTAPRWGRVCSRVQHPEQPLTAGLFICKRLPSKMSQASRGHLSEDKSNIPAAEGHGFSVFQSRALQAGSWLPGL